MNPESFGQQANNPNPSAPSQPNPAPLPPAAPWTQSSTAAQVPVNPAAPVFQPQQPVVKAKGFKKPLVVILALVVLVGSAFGAFIVVNSLSNNQEAKVGSNFITAVQDKNYAAIEKLADSQLVSLGDKINQAGGSKAKDGFYKGYVAALDKEVGIGAGEPKKVEVTKETSGGTDYAYVTYRVGTKDVTVLEVYGGQSPRVIAAESGIKAYKSAQFNVEYKQYKNYMAQMGKLVDQIVESSGSDSKQTIETMFASK